MQTFTRLLREPLLHFLAIGLALFTAYALLSSGVNGGDGSERIAVTAAEIGWLKQNFQARWLRPPTETELRGLVDDYVRQEVLYREALAMGLDSNDEVIRRRMVQKIEFMTEDLAAQAQPTEAELQTYFQENLDDYLIPERRSFTHIYFDLDRSGQDAVDRAEQLLAELRAAGVEDIDASVLGDRFMLEHDYQIQSRVEVERAFGQRFAASLFELSPGEWQGPIASGYGLHLVQVTEVRKGEVPELAAVRDEVLRDHAAMVKQQAREAMYTTLADQYIIEIDEATIRDMSLVEDAGGEGR
jgi:hypothetical protein